MRIHFLITAVIAIFSMSEIALSEIERCNNINEITYSCRLHSPNSKEVQLCLTSPRGSGSSFVTIGTNTYIKKFRVTNQENNIVYLKTRRLKKAENLKLFWNLTAGKAILNLNHITFSGECY